MPRTIPMADLTLKVLKDSIVRLNADIKRYEGDYTYYSTGANQASAHRDGAMRNLSEATEALARLRDPGNESAMEPTIAQPHIPEKLPPGPLDPGSHTKGN